MVVGCMGKEEGCVEEYICCDKYRRKFPYESHRVTLVPDGAMSSVCLSLTSTLIETDYK